KMPYLIKQYTFSYLLSASSAIHINEAKSSQTGGKALLFVPVFSTEMKEAVRQASAANGEADDPYYYLNRQPFSLRAAQRISRLVAHDLFTEQQAQEGVFKAHATQYSVLHLGTHAEINNLSPMQSRLFFAKALPDDTVNTDDGYLHAYESYGMQLRAELAVLTACETGRGALRNGEGVISLAHSFLQAGCSGVVMSLWKIDEKTNADIVSKFYEYLSKGMDKSEALRKAKLDFMAANDGELDHPYYWAGLALIGDSDPIYTGHRWRYWLIGLVAAAAFVAGWIYFSRRNVKAGKW